MKDDRRLTLVYLFTRASRIIPFTKLDCPERNVLFHNFFVPDESSTGIDIISHEGLGILNKETWAVLNRWGKNLAMDSLDCLHKLRKALVPEKCRVFQMEIISWGLYQKSLESPWLFPSTYYNPHLRIQLFSKLWIIINRLSRCEIIFRIFDYEVMLYIFRENLSTTHYKIHISGKTMLFLLQNLEESIIRKFNSWHLPSLNISIHISEWECDKNLYRGDEQGLFLLFLSLSSESMIGFLKWLILSFKLCWVFTGLTTESSRFFFRFPFP